MQLLKSGWLYGLGLLVFLIETTALSVFYIFSVPVSLILIWLGLVYYLFGRSCLFHSLIFIGVLQEVFGGDPLGYYLLSLSFFYAAVVLLTPLLGQAFPSRVLVFFLSFAIFTLSLALVSRYSTSFGMWIREVTVNTTLFLVFAIFITRFTEKFSPQRYLKLRLSGDV